MTSPEDESPDWPAWAALTEDQAAAGLGAASGPGCGGGVRLVPGLGERLTSPAVSRPRSPEETAHEQRRSDAVAR